MSSPQGIIIRNNDQFSAQFHNLNSSSIICCRLRLVYGEEHILTDLSERGVTLIPSATSQLASRSKVHQARIFSQFMVPGTQAVYDTNQLLQCTSLLRRMGSGPIIVKQDRKNGGLGIHRYSDIEDVYNHAAFAELKFPFVIQPFLEDFRDIRLIVLGDYVEAYERRNTFNFRQNMHCGGEAVSFSPDGKVIDFCREVMRRGCFPYAHIDLMACPEGQIYLTEINLRGGLRGAAIEPAEYKKKIAGIHDKLLAAHIPSA